MANPKGLSVEPTSGLPTVGQSPSGVDPAGEPANGAIESSAAPASVPAGPHFLESEWVMWEHRAPDKNSKSYEDNMAKLCEFATIEDFWRLWNNIPKPSAIFYDGRTKKKFKDRTVESFSLFKKGVKPEWEDAANRTGAEWFCRKTFPMPQLVSAPGTPCCGTHVPRRHPCRQGSLAEPRSPVARRIRSGRTSCSAWSVRPLTLRTRFAALAVSAPSALGPLPLPVIVYWPRPSHRHPSGTLATACSERRRSPAIRQSSTNRAARVACIGSSSGSARRTRSSRRSY